MSAPFNKGKTDKPEQVSPKPKDISIACAKAIRPQQYKPLNPEGFPDAELTSKGYVPHTTLPNTAHMLTEYEITVYYNEISKDIVINIPGVTGSIDNYHNNAIETITSLCVLNGLRSSLVLRYINVIADQNRINPIAEFMASEEWDQIDRIEEICNTLVTDPNFPEELKKAIITKWLISIVAAAMMPEGFAARLVLVLQGRQSMGKTTWFANLFPEELSRKYVLLGHHLDPAQKDSVLTAISHILCELGELDSSFKKDVARLKGFLTNSKDRLRRPYGRTDVEYQRRTVFCASVNEVNFLVDSTGNSRFATLPVTEIDYLHEINLPQLWAQLFVLYQQGNQWWLTQAQERSLEKNNRNHQAISSIEERIYSYYDFDHDGCDIERLTATEVLQNVDINRPTNSQCREAGKAIRSLFGEPKKNRGLMKWALPKPTKYLKPIVPHDHDDSIEF